MAGMKREREGAWNGGRPALLVQPRPTLTQQGQAGDDDLTLTVLPRCC